MELPNWSKVVQDLIDLGWSQRKIAHAIDTAPANINRLLKGERTDPQASIALPLIRLHESVMAKEHRRKMQRKRRAREKAERKRLRRKDRERKVQNE